ncbi:VOC family protein [Candidatus Pristimantibacillus sp. PTI5]|uniref:VOC family protein n=1 Tax=Candidatus Pristimantibacillus sp. PTI5 TaxID=3400422 RepID=UPI003B01DE8A
MESSNDTFTLKVGNSDLIFEQTDSVEKSPFYHFAFDIPENKIDESIAWLNSVGVTLNVLPDNSYKAYSKTWNATSIYFYDPAGNIVEFIARHTLDNAILTPFTGKELLNISEIGLVVNDVKSIKDLLSINHLITGYKDSKETFAAVGDEDGLFILSEYRRVWLGSEKKADIFKTEITVEGTQEGVFAIGQYPYNLSLVNSSLN